MPNDDGEQAQWAGRGIPLSPVALATEPAALTAKLPASSHTSVFNPGAPQVVVALSRAVVDFDAGTPSVSIEGATVASVSAHVVGGEPANACLVTLAPEGTGDITFRLVADHSCADGGICTADGAALSAGVAVTIAAAEHPENGATTTVTYSGSAPTLGPDGGKFEIVSGALRFPRASRLRVPDGRRRGQHLPGHDRGWGRPHEHAGRDHQRDQRERGSPGLGASHSALRGEQHGGRGRLQRQRPGGRPDHLVPGRRRRREVHHHGRCAPLRGATRLRGQQEQPLRGHRGRLGRKPHRARAK